MTLLDRIFKTPEQKPANPIEDFKNYFEHILLQENNPYEMALSSLQELDQEATASEELRSFLTEDIIYTSLYATYYEQVFITIKDHPHLAIALIEKFKENKISRENQIAGQTQEHMDYLLNDGFCSGCAYCNDHKDIDELLAFWKNQDMDFFIKLYVGMQTIQFSFESLLYEYIPTNFEQISSITSESILEFRKHVYQYAQSELSKM
jgi:hypothetical protein